MFKILKFTFVSVLLFLTKIFIASSQNDFEQKIVRGREDENDTLAKYVVSLRRKLNNPVFGSNHYCAGAILNPRKILTAASCLMFDDKKRMNESDIEIYAGDPVRTIKHDYVQLVYAEKLYIHSKYDAIYNKADVGLIFLTADLIEDGVRVQRVQLIDIPPEKGWECTACGWGLLYNDRPNEDDGPMPNKINYANVTISDKPTYEIGTLGEDVTEKVELRRGTCFKDTGGPLLCNGEMLTGISSYQLGFCGFKSIFTNVYFYRMWILTDYKHGKCDTHGVKYFDELLYLNTCWSCLAKVAMDSRP